MPSLRQLAERHESVLFIDAASSRVQVGIWKRGRRERWAASSDEAGVGLFTCIEETRVSLAEISAFAFCEGPGSILGIRTAAMAIRTWNVLHSRPVYGYNSLALVAHASARQDLAIIADARRDTWHHYRIGSGLQRLETSQLTGELAMPEHFRHWSNPPPNITRLPYHVPDLLEQVIDRDLFHATEAPDAFLHEEPKYVTWTPQVHRGP